MQEAVDKLAELRTKEIEGMDVDDLSQGQMAVLVNGDALRVRAADQQESRSPNLEMFIIGGVPLRQPTFQYGPFVMSTKSEVIEAFEDFQAGRFGHIPADAIQPHRPQG